MDSERSSRDAVIVAGGGPVGAIAALLLAQQDVPVVLLEAEAGVVLDYRASTFHPPTLDLLAPSGATDALLQRGLKAPLMQIRDRRDGLIAEFDYGLLANDTAYPFRLQCEQFKLVDWAYGALAAFPHVQRRFQARVVDLRQTANDISVDIESPRGRETITGRYLVAADGGRSTVRKLLDIDFPGYTHPEHFLVAGTRFDFKANMPGICSVNYTADPVEWYFLLEIPDMWRIVLPVPAGIDATDARSDEYMQAALANIFPRPDPYEIVVRAIYRVSQRVAERYRVGRAFLAGDAAHINNPLGGVGLNGGLHDAIDLAARLARVMHGTGSDETLEGYERRRRPEAIESINAMTERNKKILEERDPLQRKINRDHLARTASDPAAAYAYVLNASMIASLRRSGMLAAA